MTSSREARHREQNMHGEAQGPAAMEDGLLTPVFVRLFRKSYLSSCIFLYSHHVCPKEAQHSLAKTLALILILIYSCCWLDKCEHE